jgi:hypothetical protein
MLILERLGELVFSGAQRGVELAVRGVGGGHAVAVQAAFQSKVCSNQDITFQVPGLKRRSDASCIWKSKVCNRFFTMGQGAGSRVGTGRFQDIVTGFSRWVKGQAQGLEPGAFKLWVKLDSTSTAPTTRAFSAAIVELNERCRSVAVQVDPMKANFEP